MDGDKIVHLDDKKLAERPDPVTTSENGRSEGIRPRPLPPKGSDRVYLG